MARTLLSLAVLSLLASCSCDVVQCMRHSDCPQELVCDAGACGVPLSADTDTDADAVPTPDTDTDASDDAGSSGSGGSSSSSSGDDGSTSGDVSSTGGDSSITTDTGTTGLVDTDTDTDTDTDGTSALPLARTPQWP